MNSKDAANKGFGMTDATQWAGMVEGEAAAQEAYTVADDGATAADEAAVAAAQGGQTNADTQAAASQADGDAAAEADYEVTEAHALAKEEQAALGQEASASPDVGSDSLVDWLDYEDTLLAAQAAYQGDESAQQVKYTDAVEQNEVNYVDTDVSDYLTELDTILADDLTGGTSDATMAGNDLAQFNTTAGDEVTFETTLAPDVQAYQDTIAKDAHDEQWAVAQAAHDLAIGLIDRATYQSQVSAAETNQSSLDEAAAALYQSEVGGATITQIESDADAALANATDDAGAAKGASDADALAIDTYTKAESAAYAGEEEADAVGLEQTQSQDAIDELSDVESFAANYLPDNWNLQPWIQQAVAQAQAQTNLVNGVTGQEGTLEAQLDLTDAEAADQANQEQDDADAEYTRDQAADLDEYNETVGEGQAAHDAQYATAASDQAMVTAGAFPLPPDPQAGAPGQGEGGLPPVSVPPSDGTPLTASANYGLLGTIGGYTVGPTTGSYQGIVGGMFSLGPSMGPGYSGWNGWYGWENAWAPAASAAGSTSGSGGATSGSGASTDSAGGVWSSDGATPPPQAPQILAFAGAAENESVGEAQGGAGAQPAGAPPASGTPAGQGARGGTVPLQFDRPAGPSAEVLEAITSWGRTMMEAEPSSRWMTEVESLIRRLDAAGAPLDAETTGRLRAWISAEQARSALVANVMEAAKNASLPPGVLRVRAGKDIGDALRRGLAALEGEFNKLSEEKKVEILNALNRPPRLFNAWDIQALIGDNPVGFGIAKEGPAKDTVTVDGVVYWAPAVNYILWGKINRLLHDSLGEYTNLQWTLNKANAWRTLKSKLDGGDVEAALIWATKRDRSNY